MEGSLLLSLSDGFVIEQVSREEQRVIVSVRSTASLARCPLCAAASESMHSHYLRTVADLPIGGQLVILKLIVRRFFCRNALCTRRIFTERLPDLVQPWAQMTNRLREALCTLSFATCAEVGSRLAPHLGIRCSPSTLLRCQKAASLAPPESFTKIGLDDFAFRRGRTYGTIIVNLETHRLIDVLPDRTVETVAAWLAAHPDIEVISRDRASDYATAATTGAPIQRRLRGSVSPGLPAPNWPAGQKRAQHRKKHQPTGADVCAQDAWDSAMPQGKKRIHLSHRTQRATFMAL